MARYTSLNRKAQAFALDFIVSIILFAIVLIFMFKYTPRIQGQDFDSIEAVYYDAEIVSNTLRSQGYPPDWDYDVFRSVDYSRMGLMSSGSELDTYKVQQMEIASRLNYSRTRSKLGIRSDYGVHFIYPNGTHLNISNITYFGDESVGFDPALGTINISALDASNLAMFKRAVIYNYTSIYMVVYTWN